MKKALKWAAIARGAHLEGVTFCTACHGEDLQGDLLFEAPGIATLYAPNLTAGRGGRGAVYDDVDWVRAIRHGVSPEGRGLMIMHSDAYNHLGAGDLAAVIAYIKSVPPVDNPLPGPRVTSQSDGQPITMRGSLSARRPQYFSPSLGSGKISSTMSRMRS